MLKVSQLSKGFRCSGQHHDSARVLEGRFMALAEISFDAPAGQVLAIVGRNGAGKTTLLRILATALEPDSGEVLLDGVPVLAQPLQARRAIGVLSGETGLYGKLSVRENLRFFARLYGLAPARFDARIALLGEQLQMTPYLDQRVETLSTGMAQRAAIARSLIHDPQLVILDEPTTGLDIAATELVIATVQQLRQQGKVVLFCTHHCSEIDLLCDHLLLIVQGQGQHFASLPQFQQHYGYDATYPALVRAIAEAP